MAASIYKCWQILIHVFVLVSLVGFAGGYALYADEIVDRIVAVVNDDIVTHREVEAEMVPFVKRIKEAGYPPDVEQEMMYRVRQDVVKKLVDQKLTDQEIKRYKISVSEEDIDNNIEQIKAEKKWTDEDMRKALQIEGLSMEAYRKGLKQQALRTKLVNRVVKSNIVITTEDIAAYYAENSEKFAGDLKYQLRNIIMRVADGAGIDEKETAKQRMQQLRLKLIAGQSIESVIQAYRNSSTKLISSNLGVLNYADFAPQLKAALDGLPQGGYTTILETPQGYQIFYIEDILREDALSLEQASPKIEEILLRSLTEKAFVEWIESLREGSHIKLIL